MSVVSETGEQMAEPVEVERDGNESGAVDTQAVEASERDAEKAAEMERRKAEYMKKREEAIEKVKAQCLDVLLKQTTWTEEEALEKLEANKYNVKACVRIFMGLPPLKEVSDTHSSLNQGIFSEIRGMMDEASERHERKKRYEEQMAIKQAQMQAQAAAYAKAKAEAEANAEAKPESNGNDTTQSVEDKASE